jgi:transposase
MEQYVALDVSLKEISVCIIDSKGEVIFEGKTAAEPAMLVELIRSKAPQVKRVGLETGATSPWLFHALASAGLPVVCMDARHAHAAPSIRPTKSTAAMPEAWPTCCAVSRGTSRATWHDADNTRRRHQPCDAVN